MTTDCSLNYKFNTWKFQAQTWGEHVVCRSFVHNMFSTCSAKRRASDKDLPVLLFTLEFFLYSKTTLIFPMYLHLLDKIASLKNPYQFPFLSIAGLTQKAQDYKELLWNSCIGSRPHWLDYDSTTNDTGRGMNELKIAKNGWKTPKTANSL